MVQEYSYCRKTSRVAIGMKIVFHWKGTRVAFGSIMDGRVMGSAPSEQRVCWDRLSLEISRIMVPFFSRTVP
jgi:hypothetical protein